MLLRALAPRSPPSSRPCPPRPSTTRACRGARRSRRRSAGPAARCRAPADARCTRRRPRLRRARHLRRRRLPADRGGCARERHRRGLLRPPALEGEPLRRLGGQPRGRAGHRPVHARDGEDARPRRRLQPGRGALRLRRLPRRALPRLRQHRPRRRRLQRRRGRPRALPRREVAACPPRPAPTSPRSPATRSRPGATRRPRRSTSPSPGAATAAFQAACVAQAEKRSVKEFRSGPKLAPWGVVVASNRENAGAERQVKRLQNRYAAVLGGEEVAYSGGRSPGLRTPHGLRPGRPRHPRRGRRPLHPPPRRRRRLHGAEELTLPRPSQAHPPAPASSMDDTCACRLFAAGERR